MRGTRGLGAAMVIAAGAFALATTPAPAKALPSGFSDSAVTAGFSSPTALEILPGGRIAVLEKSGAVKIVGTGGGVTTAITLPVCTASEMGLLSMAVDPDFANNGYVYLYRTRPGGGAGDSCAPADRMQQLSRFTMTGDTIDPASEVIYISGVPATGGNHDGGTVEFGRDGMIYLSIGDAGSPPRGSGATAQDLSLLNGKILRLSPSGGAAPGNPYLTAPNHGPCSFTGLNAPTDRVCDEIYAIGLRNPFRMAFDPNSARVRFRINDVGQNSFEEVDEGVLGANYGWPLCEGLVGRSGGNRPIPCAPEYRDPLTTYPRSDGEYIVGGAFVPNGWWGPPFDGGYLFADGGSGKLWLLPASGAVDYANPVATDLGVAADMSFGVRNGERALFYIDTSGGELRKITAPGAATADPAGPAYVVAPGSTEPSAVPPIVTRPGASTLVAYPTAQRVYDTRNAIGGPAGEVPGGTTRTVSLGVPAGARAALVNVTLTADSPAEGLTYTSYLTAWEPGTPMPATSNANVGADGVAANLSVLAVDGNGATNVFVFNHAHVILDVLGYYVDAPGPVAAGRFQALTPSRLADTRATPGAGEYSRTTNGSASVVKVPVGGRAGIPSSVRTVALTVTALGAVDGPSGYVTAYASGATRPATSNVNHAGAGDTRANLAIVPVGADGSVELYLFDVSDVVVDVAGWVTSEVDPPGTSGRLRMVDPQRIADSRSDVGFSLLAPGSQAVIDPTGIPASATAVVQNVTMVSWRTGWICATPNPWSGGDVSVQNSSREMQARPALTFTTLGSTANQPRLRYCTQNYTDVVVDVLAWFE